MRQPHPLDRRQGETADPEGELRVRRVLGSIDRDEAEYRVLLAFSIGFAALRVFMTARGIWGTVSTLMAHLAVWPG